MKRLIFFLLAYLSCYGFYAQEDIKNYEFSAYISNMQSFSFTDINSDWINDNLIHNRLNFKWFPTDELTLNIGVRNRVFTGESVKMTNNYGEFIKNSDFGIINGSWNIIDKKSVIFNSAIDRFFVQYQSANFSATVGRQRINWGKTFVWNPNDIFNAYSFFDFDYAEKAGSDAIRLEYYTGAVSSVEIAAKIDKNEDITAAALWRFNKWDYDFQTLAGIFNSRDYVVGAAWSGAIKSLDFKGEITYLHSKTNMQDTTGQLIGTISTSYNFTDKFNMRFEFLYTDIANNISNFAEYYYNAVSIKSLSFTKYNLFLQASYQISPLLASSASCMYYPEIEGTFVGTTFDYSFTDNLYFSIVIQNFNGKLSSTNIQQSNRENITYAFLRLKWNF